MRRGIRRTSRPVAVPSCWRKPTAGSKDELGVREDRLSILPVGWRPRIALPAFEHPAERRFAALRGRHPRAVDPRRVVPHVLEVAAGELRDPVAFVVPMKPAD